MNYESESKMIKNSSVMQCETDVYEFAKISVLRLLQTADRCKICPGGNATIEHLFEQFVAMCEAYEAYWPLFVL